MEDIKSGDDTTNFTISDNAVFKAIISAKADGVIAGLEIAGMVFRELHNQIEFRSKAKDGEYISNGDVIAEIQGNGRAILTAERTALNFLQRMSGIATNTRLFVDAVRGTKAHILDTRKTVPGLRYLDKYAVKAGGGKNHRIGLFDMFLIKENHIEAAGGITEAVQKIRQHDKKHRSIEVEVKNLNELKEAIELKVDRIMLDNMSTEDMQTAVHMTNGKIPLEASGNVTIDNVRDIAETGVDFISAGSLTHSVTALDMSLIITGGQD